MEIALGNGAQTPELFLSIAAPKGLRFRTHMGSGRRNRLPHTVLAMGDVVFLPYVFELMNRENRKKIIILIIYFVLIRLEEQIVKHSLSTVGCSALRIRPLGAGPALGLPTGWCASPP